MSAMEFHPLAIMSALAVAKQAIERQLAA